MEIGVKLKALRLQCGLTQEEVADRCELTKGYISQLENDLTSPSIATLLDLLTTLGTSLKEFFNEESEHEIIFSPDNFFEKVTDDSVVSWLVLNSQKNLMEPILLKLQPHANTTTDMPHEGEEFGYILEGQVKIHLGKKSYTAAQHNSFYYTCNKQHYLENITDQPALILWVSTPPTF